MGGKNLFVLAGCRGAGKSTLLAHALKSNVPIFGVENSEAFLRTRPLEGGFEETLKGNGVFKAVHIPMLSGLEVLPDVVVLHLEITGVLYHYMNDVYYRKSMPDDVRASISRDISGLVDTDLNRKCFSFYINDCFFSRFDNVVINTLVTSYEKNIAQWVKRSEMKKKKHSLLRRITDTVRGNVSRWDELFDSRRPRPEVYDAILTAWFEALRQRPGCVLLRTEVVDGVPRVTPLNGA